MPNRDAHTHRTEDPPPYPADHEHGYQDARDQLEREEGRDDFRGFSSAGRPVRRIGDADHFGDRYRAGDGWSQGGRDQWAERDRDLYADGLRDRDDPSAVPRESMLYRGQSGSQAGGHVGEVGWGGRGYEGGHRGHWGDFDRGGQSGLRGGPVYDAQSPYTYEGSSPHTGDDSPDDASGLGEGPSPAHDRSRTWPDDLRRMWR